MFAFPIVAALIGDGKSKKKSSSGSKNPSPTATRTFTTGKVLTPTTIENKQKRAATPVRFEPIRPSYNEEIKAEQTIKREEPVADPTAYTEGKSAEEIKREKRKLIIYSEILKPKFDE